MIRIFFFFFSLFLLYFISDYSWILLVLFLGFITFYLLKYMYISILSYSFVSRIFCIDSVRIILILLTFWITAIIFMSSQIVFINKNNSVFFCFIVLILCLVLVGTFIVNNLILFYILFEISLIPTLVVILGWGYQPERLQAGIYMMIYTIRSSLPFLLGLIYVYYRTGTLFIYFPFSLKSDNLILEIWWLTIIFAFIVKIPIYLTHLWLPKAHVEAPVAGSIILAGVLLKLGGYGLLRISSLLLICNSFLVPFFVRVSMWGAFITRIICLRQTDLKSLIAYSSVGHIGLVIGGIISGQFWGWYGCLVIIIAHGLVSSGLFSIGNITYENTGTRRIYIIKGLLRILPSISIFWFIFRVMNIGAPPSINLLGEIILITRILNISFWMRLLLGISRFLAAAYSLYLYTSIHHGQFSSIINVVYPGSSRNITVIFFHIFPAIFFIISSQFISLFGWLRSWITILNCSFKGVYITGA